MENQEFDVHLIVTQFQATINNRLAHQRRRRGVRVGRQSQSALLPVTLYRFLIDGMMLPVCDMEEMIALCASQLPRWRLGSFPPGICVVL